MDSGQPGRRKPSLRSRAMWFVRARPADYLLVMSEMSAGLPLVGKYFQPFGGITAMAQRRRYLHRGAVRYGDAPSQVLDVWRRDDLTGPAPVPVFVPGGG